MKNCPNCNSSIATDSNICTKCGWRPYHGVLDGETNVYPIAEQNFKYISITSVFLAAISIVFCFFPLWINKAEPSEQAISSLFLGFSTLIILLYAWLLTHLYTYLKNFYHPLDNIFSNIKWNIASILSIPIFIALGSYFHFASDVEGIFLLLFICIYVLWAFMQILIGWSLIKAEKYDYVGGLSVLGYAMLASGILPLLFFFIPIFFSNIFIKATKYYNKLHS